jgi:uncharacterized protein (TIGR03067 family)
MRRILSLLPLVSLAFAPAPLPRPDPSKEDLKKMQGKWVLESRLYQGRPVAHVVATVEVQGDRWTYVNATGDWRAPGKLILDATKVPRRLHWGPGMHRGVYEINGDTLIFVFTTGGSPDKLRDLDGNKPLRWREVLKRAKR